MANGTEAGGLAAGSISGEMRSSHDWKEREVGREQRLSAATLPDEGKRSEGLLFFCYFCFCWIRVDVEGA